MSMTFTREELRMIQDALHDKAVHLRSGSSSQVSEYRKVSELRNRVQSHLLSDDPPITVRSPVSNHQNVSG